MWYAITAGVGVLLGLSLLIWGLREQTARHKAERAADAAATGESSALGHLADARETVNAQALELTRARVQNDAIRKTVDELRKRLVECKDVKTVQEWLDEELKDETV